MSLVDTIAAQLRKGSKLTGDKWPSTIMNTSDPFHHVSIHKHITELFENSIRRDFDSVIYLFANGTTTRLPWHL